jgi:predicted nucleic acid-binding protein
MMPPRTLVLDANMLIRAVLGRRVRQILETYAEDVHFCTPDICVQSAQDYLPDLMQRRGWPAEDALALFARVCALLTVVDEALYAAVETDARARLAGRDEEDWPVAAVALTLESPIWTEDRDFFGSGIATWTTDRVELYLQQ